MLNFFETNYDLLVTYGPIITITGFLVFYAMFLVDLLRTKKGSKFTRYAFVVLTVALLPNFFAHLSLAIVHGAWFPFIAEIANLAPVIVLLVLNEAYLCKKEVA